MKSALHTHFLYIGAKNFFPMILADKFLGVILFDPKCDVPIKSCVFLKCGIAQSIVSCVTQNKCRVNNWLFFCVAGTFSHMPFLNHYSYLKTKYWLSVVEPVHRFVLSQNKSAESLRVLNEKYMITLTDNHFRHTFSNVVKVLAHDLV